MLRVVLGTEPDRASADLTLAQSDFLKFDSPPLFCYTEINDIFTSSRYVGVFHCSIELLNCIIHGGYHGVFTSSFPGPSSPTLVVGELGESTDENRKIIHVVMQIYVSFEKRFRRWDSHLSKVEHGSQCQCDWLPYLNYCRKFPPLNSQDHTCVESDVSLHAGRTTTKSCNTSRPIRLM